MLKWEIAECRGWEQGGIEGRGGRPPKKIDTQKGRGGEGGRGRQGKRERDRQADAYTQGVRGGGFGGGGTSQKTSRGKGLWWYLC